LVQAARDLAAARNVLFDQKKLQQAIALAWGVEIVSDDSTAACGHQTKSVCSAAVFAIVLSGHVGCHDCFDICIFTSVLTYGTLFRSLLSSKPASWLLTM